MKLDHSDLAAGFVCVLVERQELRFVFLDE
jgi:hypothetical protein